MTIVGKKQAAPSLEEIYNAHGLNPETIPKHIAIVMDGNGRWAKKRNLPRVMGHKRGAEALRQTISSCVDLGIHYLSFYAFSTENWNRPKTEVQFLMNLIKTLTEKEVPELIKKGARIKIIGNKEGLSQDLQDSLAETEKKTAHNTTIQVNLMINYGSRSEIIQAVKKVATDYAKSPFEITEDIFSNYLFTENVPDPDIFIRTSGERRISNYLLWQISYSELFFIETLWPDFGKESLIDVIKEFQTRNRRFGGL
ncbi:MAG: undecaprenyl diphosphate synthase [Candidatus Marinamargulisbacteria bacterium]|jgi:undecaprenyl diphosphate synthase